MFNGARAQVEGEKCELWGKARTLCYIQEAVAHKKPNQKTNGKARHPAFAMSHHIARVRVYKFHGLTAAPDRAGESGTMRIKSVGFCCTV